MGIENSSDQFLNRKSLLFHSVVGATSRHSLDTYRKFKYSSGINLPEMKLKTSDGRSNNDFFGMSFSSHLLSLSPKIFWPVCSTEMNLRQSFVVPSYLLLVFLFYEM